MGQYYKGSKIGTCDAMYYLRLSQAQVLAHQGQKDDDGIKFQDYLEDNTTKFRFPFPEEDGMPQEQLLVRPNYEPSVTIPAGCLQDTIGHDTITASNKLADGSDNLNIFVPCPYSQQFRNMGIHHSPIGETSLDIIMEGVRDGKVKTIFRCSRCGEMQRFDDEAIAKLKEYLREYYQHLDMTGKNPGYPGDQEKYDYMMKVIDRLK